MLLSAVIVSKNPLSLRTSVRDDAVANGPRSLCIAITSFVLAQVGIDPIDIGLDVVATALVDNLAASHATDVRPAKTIRRQIAADAVDAFAENNLDAFGALAQHRDFHELTAFGDTHLDLFDVHEVMDFAC